MPAHHEALVAMLFTDRTVTITATPKAHGLHGPAAPKVHDLHLHWMQIQTILAESLRKHVIDPPGIFLAFDHDDKIVRLAYQKGVRFQNLRCG